MFEKVEHPSKGLMQVAKLNAALWLFAKKKSDSIEEGWEMLGQRDPEPLTGQHASFLN